MDLGGVSYELEVMLGDVVCFHGSDGVGRGRGENKKKMNLEEP